MTKNQRGNVILTLAIGAVIVIIAIAVLAIIAVKSPATATPVKVPSVDTSHYTQIVTQNDGTIDHYCDGTDGIWYGGYNGQFSVMKDDPLCH